MPDDIHLWVISHQESITKIRLKFTYLNHHTRAMPQTNLIMQGIPPSTAIALIETQDLHHHNVFGTAVYANLGL